MLSASRNYFVCRRDGGTALRSAAQAVLARCAVRRLSDECMRRKIKPRKARGVRARLRCAAAIATVPMLESEEAQAIGCSAAPDSMRQHTSRCYVYGEKMRRVIRRHYAVARCHHAGIHVRRCLLRDDVCWRCLPLARYIIAMMRRREMRRGEQHAVRIRAARRRAWRYFVALRYARLQREFAITMPTTFTTTLLPPRRPRLLITPVTAPAVCCPPHGERGVCR